MARSATTSAQFPTIAQPYTHIQRYTLDSNGNRTTTTDAANTTTQQSFDAQNRLTVSTTPGEGSTHNTWNKDGTLASIDHGNGTQTRYQYDRAKRITAITHTQNGATTLSFTYTYDQNGNRTSEVRTQSAINGQAGSIQTTTYAYDRDDRLIQTTVSHQPSDPTTPDERTDWTLDPVGNRLTETVTRMADNTASSNKSYVYNERDQLTLMTDSVNALSVEYSYDQNGNRTSRTVTKQGQPSETIQYTFDARDRLIQAEPNAPNPGNAATVAYRYDPDGRRIERIEAPANGAAALATLYLYNGSTLQHEATPDATATTANATGLRLTDTYRTSAKLDRHIGFDLAGTPTIRLYQLDALDSPVALTDASGNTVTRTTYNAWGEIDQQVANGVVQTPWQLPNYNPDQTGQAALLSNDGQTLGFTGYQKDNATGLYYAGARWYDPLVGGFNAMDPANGNPNTPVSFHRYLYGNANPLIYIDPSGRVGFLTTARNFFNRTDERLREVAVLLPSFADEIGVGRGALALLSVPVRGVNLVSDVVAQALPGNAFSTVADQGSAELGTTVDALVPLARDYIAYPEYTKARVQLALATAAVNTLGSAAQGNGGAISDLTSFGTQIAVPFAAGEAALAKGVNLSTKVGDLLGAGAKLAKPATARGASAVRIDGETPPSALGDGASAAQAGRAAELPEGGVGAGAAKSRPSTWNEFQATTRGQFATRAEAAQAWAAFKVATKTIATPTAGQKIYRVYGGDSAAGGASWSPVNPGSAPNFRDAAGLPSGGASGFNNTGRFVIEATLVDPSKVVKTRPALALDGNAGGVDEFIIPDWIRNGAIRVDRVSGVNPEF